MKVKYFQDTDTLHIEFRAGNIVETRDLDEDTLLEIDGQGRVCALTLEHAQVSANMPAFSFEQVAA